MLRRTRPSCRPLAPVHQPGAARVAKKIPKAPQGGLERRPPPPPPNSSTRYETPAPPAALRARAPPAGGRWAALALDERKERLDSARAAAERDSIAKRLSEGKLVDCTEQLSKNENRKDASFPVDSSASESADALPSNPDSVEDFAHLPREFVVDGTLYRFVQDEEAPENLLHELGESASSERAILLDEEDEGSIPWGLARSFLDSHCAFPSVDMLADAGTIFREVIDEEENIDSRDSRSLGRKSSSHTLDELNGAITGCLMKRTDLHRCNVAIAFFAQREQPDLSDPLVCQYMGDVSDAPLDAAKLLGPEKAAEAAKSESQGVNWAIKDGRLLFRHLPPEHRLWAKLTFYSDDKKTKTAGEWRVVCRAGTDERLHVDSMAISESAISESSTSAPQESIDITQLSAEFQDRVHAYLDHVGLDDRVAFFAKLYVARHTNLREVPFLDTLHRISQLAGVPFVETEPAEAVSGSSKPSM